MGETDFDLPEDHRVVGVVKRSEAPLIERLLTEREHPRYQVALPERPTFRKWIFDMNGVPMLMSLLSLLEAARMTR